MDILTRFELRKIIRRKSFYTGIIILIAVAILSSVVLITNMQMTGEDGKFLNGTAAIQLEREYNRQLAGPLTIAAMEAAVRRHQDLLHDPSNLDEKGEMTVEANAKYDTKDNQIQFLITDAFSPASEYDYYLIDKINPEEMKSFYQKRLEKVRLFLNSNKSDNNYTAKEKAYFTKLNEEITVPFQMDYVTGWKNVFENLPSLFLIIAFVIGFCLAPVFAGEYQRGTDAIVLSTRYGRSKAIAAKLKASFIVSVGLIIFPILIYTFLILGVFGFDGGGAHVQMIKFLAPVPYTVFETYLWAVLIGSLACLMVGALTLWFSSRMSNSFSVIVATGVLLVGTQFIPESKNSRLLSYLTDLLPGNMFDSFRKITGYDVFNIVGQLVPTYKIMVVFSIIAIALLIPFTYRAFKKHQVV
ncbi:ABC transporter permease subunit [Paenibacillus sp. FSL H7-0756]|uniref:ABC transporter permease subunit n=1 Tax=Paenibacillus sp. FSL H7-0756 TaxID=2954738 RepID=UPI0030F5123D